jgi:ABC-2 type transport system ATP-binding protein
MHETEKTSRPKATSGVDWMIEADGLTKYYGTFIAVKDMTFRVPRGQVVAFLGPNGAGKSTTMKMLTGYLAASAGTARIAGFDMATDRIAGAERLGYLPENGPLYPDMTPRSLLEFFADARGLSGSYKAERIEAVIRQCELGSVIGKAIDKLQGLPATRRYGPGAAARTRCADPRRADQRTRSQSDPRGSRQYSQAW